MDTIEIFALTDSGTKALANEDHILVGRFIKNRGQLYLKLPVNDDIITDYGLLLAVSDGIGETAGGEAASQQTLFSFEQRYYTSPKGRYAQQALADAMEYSNHFIHDIHYQRIVVDRQIGFFINRCQLKLIRSYFIMPGFYRNAQQHTFLFEIAHKGHRPVWNAPEIMVV